MAQASGIYNRAVAIATSNTVNYDGSTYAANAATKAIPAESLFVGGAGVVVAVFEDGTTGSFTVTAGTLLPLKTIRINSTNTTASLLLALYQV